MLEGFLIGMAVWAGPALIAWIVVGPKKLGKKLSHH